MVGITRSKVICSKHGAQRWSLESRDLCPHNVGPASASASEFCQELEKKIKKLKGLVKSVRHPSDISCQTSKCQTSRLSRTASHAANFPGAMKEAAQKELETMEKEHEVSTFATIRRRKATFWIFLIAFVYPPRKSNKYIYIMCVYVCMSVCLSVCMDGWMYVCMCIYI